MDTSFAFGDPDVGGPSWGNAAANRLSAPEVAPGFFFAIPEPRGPFGASGVPPGSSANLVAVANTNPFDSSVTASTGDVWAGSVDPNATYSPLTLAPGQSGTITVTFTPSGRRGRVVRGFIGLDTFNLVTDSGDEVTTIPYEYKIH
jgi:hypothetical protein